MKEKNKKIVVNDFFQKNYSYFLTEPVGKNFHPDFRPDLTPEQMLGLGVFGGKYMTDGAKEFPKKWFVGARLSSGKSDHNLNFFKVKASQPLAVWRKKGWINNEHDPRGWFQWYCRYYMGRRLPEEDLRQIKRWKAMKRHLAQVTKNCRVGDFSCHSKQRQALLHWAYDSRKI